MSLGKRLIKVGLPACLTDTTDIFGDSNGVALYSLDYDASDAGGLYDGSPTDVDFGVGGQINYGARFNGSSSRIENIDTTPLSTATSFSVSVWIKTTSTSRNFIYGDTKYINNTILGIDNNRIEARSVSSTSVFSSTLTISDGNWHNIVMTVVSGGAFKVYFDNSEVINTTVGTFSSASGYQTIGVYRSLTPTYVAFFNGSIDQVRIFSKALSSDEVSTLYAETACVYDCTTDTTDIGGTNQSYYKFDNDVLDYSGNGYDGTSSSMVFSFGKFGQAAIGDDTTRNFVNPQPFNTGDTISFWTKRINAAGGSFGIFGQHDGTYDFVTCRLHYNNDNTHKIQLYVRNSVSAYRYTQTSYVADNGNWSHWVITLNSPSSNPTVYLNSVQQSVSINNSSGSMSSYAQSNARIGRGYINGTVYNMNGYLDQMRTFTSARTTDQVTELYNEKQCLDTSNFKTVLYEGNGATQYISNVGMDLETDGGLSWLKERTSTSGHQLRDSVRGVSNYILSSSTAAEASNSNLTSFDANGFTLGVTNGLNENGQDYVAWCWKGGGDAVSNTDGSITSQVSANADAGFSIVKYTGNGTAGATVGHGLSSAPDLIIVKLLDATKDWYVFSELLGQSGGEYQYLELNTTDAATTFATQEVWNGDLPTSDLFTLTGGSADNLNNNDYIAYCFHSVSGYSKIGSFVGDGSTDTVLNLGFEPKWIMIKNANTTTGWFIMDFPRDNFAQRIRAEVNNIESSIGTLTTSSTGITISSTASDGRINGRPSQTDTMLYMAFK